MKQLKIPAVFMRGGTSNAIVLHERDLPRDRAEWDEIFLAAIGSPDPYGRQLDGMGGGISSLSKVCVVGPPTRPDADNSYTLAHVQVNDAKVDYRGKGAPMSSSTGRIWRRRAGRNRASRNSTKPCWPIWPRIRTP